MANEELEGLELPIEWYLPEGLISRYATNMVVQRSEHEYIISFFEVKPPLILKELTAEEAKATFSSIRAECIARIVVADKRMPNFVKALQSNLERAQSVEVETQSEEAAEVKE